MANQHEIEKLRQQLAETADALGDAHQELQDKSAQATEAVQANIALRQQLERMTKLAVLHRDARLAALEQLEASQRDAVRWAWGVKNSAWLRHDHVAYIAIPVDRNANLASIGSREDVIDAAIAKGPDNE